MCLKETRIPKAGTGTVIMCPVSPGAPQGPARGCDGRGTCHLSLHPPSLAHSLKISKGQDHIPRVRDSSAPRHEFISKALGFWPTRGVAPVPRPM